MGIINPRHKFCRLMLKVTMANVRKANVPADILKEAWAYMIPGGNAEFHINKCDSLPKGYYWYGNGCCRWYAKADGWAAFLDNVWEKRSDYPKKDRHHDRNKTRSGSAAGSG